MDWNDTDFWDETKIKFAEAYRKYLKGKSNAPKDAAYSEPIDNRKV